MGRNKISIAKLPSESSRTTTFNKRCRGLIKKALEISILCDVDVGLIMFNPTKTARPEGNIGRKVTFFANPRRIEDVLTRYFRDEIRKDRDENNAEPSNRMVIHGKEGLITRLENMKIQDDNYQLDQGEPSSRNLEGSSNSAITLEDGMNPSQLAMLQKMQEMLMKKLIKTNNRFDFLHLYLRLVKWYKYMPTKDPWFWKFCEQKLAGFLEEICQQKQQQQQNWKYNNLGLPNMIKQEQQQQLQQISGHRHQASVEAFHQQKEGRMVVMGGNPGSSTHMHHAQMPSQFLNNNTQLQVSTYQAPMQASIQSTLGTQQDPIWGRENKNFYPYNFKDMQSRSYTVREEKHQGLIQPPAMNSRQQDQRLGLMKSKNFYMNNFNGMESCSYPIVKELNQGSMQPSAMSSHGEASTSQMFSTSTSYNPTTQKTGPNPCTHQQYFGGYGAHANEFCNNGQYPEYNNANIHRP